MNSRIHQLAKQLRGLPEPKNEPLRSHFELAVQISDMLRNSLAESDHQRKQSSLAECENKIAELGRIYDSSSIFRSNLGNTYIRFLRTMLSIAKAETMGNSESSDEELSLSSYSETLLQTAGKLENTLPALPQGKIDSIQGSDFILEDGTKISSTVASIMGIIGMLVGYLNQDSNAKEMTRHLSGLRENKESLLNNPMVTDEQKQFIKEMFNAAESLIEEKRTAEKGELKKPFWKIW